LLAGDIADGAFEQVSRHARSLAHTLR
jgi:hypothetical protein